MPSALETAIRRTRRQIDTLRDNGDGTYTHTFDAESGIPLSAYVRYIEAGYGPFTRWQRIRRWVANLARWR
ncbi:MAG: hypothetical protein M3457_02190 [Chloroflexota bacterium]|nr:hypothetical protein [Chloroflexota bacterium]